jgi:hypothetical protein
MMPLRTTIGLLFFSAALAGCSDPPERPGDPCDIDDQDCPAPLVCATRPSDDEDVCHIPPGSGCTLGGEDLCLDDAVCVDDGKGAAVCARIIGEGGDCDPASRVDRCADDLTCAEMQSGGYKCFAPVALHGMVFDSTTEASIEGAHVIALDDQASAVSDVAVSDPAGNYRLDIPVPRDDSGAPVGDVSFTLRASSDGYQTFPGGIRTALPINSTEAMSTDAGWAIQTAITDIALIPLPADQQGLGSISGTIVADEEDIGGVLVVADNGVGISAISDLSGRYTIFNLPDGSYTVKGYAAGLQLEPAAAEVASKGDLTGVNLVESAAALGTISGSVNIVNAPGGTPTSVVLVVESTFDDTFVRGEVPRGLRTPLSGPPDVTGAFEIGGVPEGSYVVLAAFENDLLVRDPDPNIAGTQIVTVTMPAPGQEVALDGSFKITEALEVFGPGSDSAELVDSAPALEWADDSSEDFYTVVVYDAYGDLVWCLSDAEVGGAACDGPNVPSVSGGGNVSVAYEGPLEPGMYYQFRATSWRMGGPISTTEDLRGVFFTAAP